MSENFVRIGVIGAGARACILNHLQDDRIRLTRIFDPDRNQCRRWIRETGAESTVICSDYLEITDAPDVDWVLVISPNYLHEEHIIAAFRGGKNVFAEKPLATTLNGCREIIAAYERSGKMFATGFVLRYTPLYRKAKELLDSGVIGDIIAVEANEKITPQHGTHIMTNWRRFQEFSGSHILEKCCHDLDLMNWFVGSLPSRVASFGGLDFFVPGNEALRGRFTAPETGADYFTALEREIVSPFTSEKNIIDNQVAIAEYRNHVRTTFITTLSNVMPERRMAFSGTRGNLTVEFYSGLIHIRTLGEDGVKQIKPPSGSGHGGGDAVIGQALADTMLHGAPILCSGSEGMESAVFALALEQSRREGRIVELEDTWKMLKR